MNVCVNELSDGEGLGAQSCVRARAIKSARVLRDLSTVFFKIVESTAKAEAKQVHEYKMESSPLGLKSSSQHPSG